MARTRSDYLSNPPARAPDTDYLENPRTSDDSKKPEEDKLHEWVKFVEAAERSRKEFLTQVKINRKFASGQQHLNVNYRDGRVVDVHERNGIKLATADILTQYLQTAVGRMAGNDIRPNFLASTDDERAQIVSDQLNLAFGWGWENEWLGDQKVLELWRLLVIDGTAAIRCRYDRSFGEVVGEDVAYGEDDLPILDRQEETKYRALAFMSGQKLKTGTVREGKVVWEILTFENLLPPPGIDDPANFHMEAVVRPVLIEDLKQKYGSKVAGIEEEEIESSASLTANTGPGEKSPDRLKGRVLVYTGYRRPCAEYPKGEVAIFIKNKLLESRDHLPYDSHPRGSSTGLHYFRWQVLPKRFWGRAFIEGGIGPQEIRNKRLTQVDAIIDRGMPFWFIEQQSLGRRKTGAPMEYVEVVPGSPLPQPNQGVAPGQWMMQDIKMQEENAEQAMGLRSITLGQPPQGVSAYSAMALLTENDALKLDAVAQAFNQEFKELCWDTVESMRNWPMDKEIMMAGPEDRLQAMVFSGSDIPEKYLVRMPRVGSLPRSQAAELQKITDLWTASGGKLPFEWYYNSLNAGKAQPLPPNLGDVQLHKAELENILLVQTGADIPPSDTDDHVKHVEVHRAFQTPMKTLATMGDEVAVKQHDALERHIQAHLEVAQKAATMGAPTAGPGLPPQNMPQPGGLPDVPSPAPAPTIPTPGGIGARGRPPGS